MKDTKEYIIKTSLKLFMQKSFKEVTMKEIVDKTGLSKGAFYHYFASKEAVFEEVVKYFYNNTLITDFNGFPENSLEAFYHAYLDKLFMDDAFDDLEENINLLVFISEIARKIPAYLDIHNAQKEKEMNAWSNIASIAKKNNEILSTLSSEDIAMMFLNLGDAVMLSTMFISGKDKALEMNKKAWDNLYKLLKK